MNNSKDNLEWCTAKYNSNYGHHKEKLRKSLLNSSNTWKGRHHTPEQIEKMRQAKKGMISPNRKKIIIDGIEYKSYTEAMEKLHICTRKLYKIIREKE